MATVRGQLSRDVRAYVEGLPDEKSMCLLRSLCAFRVARGRYARRRLRLDAPAEGALPALPTEPTSIHVVAHAGGAVAAYVEMPGGVPRTDLAARDLILAVQSAVAKHHAPVRCMSCGRLAPVWMADYTRSIGPDFLLSVTVLQCTYEDCVRVPIVCDMLRLFLLRCGAGGTPVHFHHACVGCGRAREAGRLSRCSRCQSVLYCSRQCQLSDWPNHRYVCRAPHGSRSPSPSQSPPRG